MAFVTTAALPRSGLAAGVTSVCRTPARTAAPVVAPQPIEAAKHVQFKAAKKAERKRPRKHRPSDINRKAPDFNPQPQLDPSLPPVWTLIKADDAAAE